MQLWRLHRGFAALALMGVVACGGGGDGTGPGGGGGTDFGMSAKVNGVAWKPSVAASGAHVIAGAYNFTGLTTQSGGSSITITLANIGGPGTYPIGVGPSTYGGTGQYVTGSQGWTTELSGAAGTITITALSNTHMTGTFAFDAVGLTGGATGTTHVTDGEFDLPITTIGTPGELTDRAGSTVTADVDGSAYNAATIAGTFPNDTSMIVASTTTTRGLGIQLYGLGGPGTYDLSTSPTHVLTFSTIDGSDFNSWGGLASDSGSIVITSRTATRVIGTFGVRLTHSLGSGSTDPVRLTGAFSIGVPQL